MKYIKTFEKIVKFKNDLQIGYKFNQGIKGLLINNAEYNNDINDMFYYLKGKNKKFRLLISNSFLLLLFPDKEDIKKSYIKIGTISRTLSFFYQDIIDEISWEEVIIENEDDIRELEEKIKFNIEVNKYNL